MRSWRAVAFAALATVACSKPETRYRPEHIHEYVLRGPAGWVLTVQIRVPRGYDHGFVNPLGKSDAMISGTRMPTFWLRMYPAHNRPMETELCPEVGRAGDVTEEATTIKLHERDAISETALCETTGRTDPYDRTLRGPSQYRIRRWIAIGPRRLECEVVLHGKPRGASRAHDASRWTANQRADLLDVCRSLRVVRMERYQSPSTPEWDRAAELESEIKRERELGLDLDAERKRLVQPPIDPTKPAGFLVDHVPDLGDVPKLDP